MLRVRPALPALRCAYVRRARPALLTLCRPRALRVRPAPSLLPRGFTLLELLFAMALVCILAGMAVPQTLSSLHRSRAWAAARYLAGHMAMARIRAVQRGAAVALRFDERGTTTTFTVIADGNRNGIRSRDVESGADVRIDGPFNITELFPGVRIGVAADGADALVIGRTPFMSFTPAGTASSGTVYIRGQDSSQYAVRVLGATGRTRVLRYVPATRMWLDYQ